MGTNQKPNGLLSKASAGGGYSSPEHMSRRSQALSGRFSIPAAIQSEEQQQSSMQFLHPSPRTSPSAPSTPVLFMTSHAAVSQMQQKQHAPANQQQQPHNPADTDVSRPTSNFNAPSFNVFVPMYKQQQQQRSTSHTTSASQISQPGPAPSSHKQQGQQGHLSQDQMHAAQQQLNHQEFLQHQEQLIPHQGQQQSAMQQALQQLQLLQQVQQGRQVQHVQQIQQGEQVHQVQQLQVVQPGPRKHNYPDHPTPAPPTALDTPSESPTKLMNRQNGPRLARGTQLPCGVFTALPTALSSPLPTALPSARHAALPSAISSGLPSSISLAPPSALPSVLPLARPFHPPTAPFWQHPELQQAITPRPSEEGSRCTRKHVDTSSITPRRSEEGSRLQVRPSRSTSRLTRVWSKLLHPDEEDHSGSLMLQSMSAAGHMYPKRPAPGLHGLLASAEYESEGQGDMMLPPPPMMMPIHSSDSSYQALSKATLAYINPVACQENTADFEEYAGGSEDVDLKHLLMLLQSTQGNLQDVQLDLEDTQQELELTRHALVQASIKQARAEARATINPPPPAHSTKQPRDTSLPDEEQSSSAEEAKEQAAVASEREAVLKQQMLQLIDDNLVLITQMEELQVQVLSAQSQADMQAQAAAHAQAKAEAAAQAQAQGQAAALAQVQAAAVQAQAAAAQAHAAAAQQEQHMQLKQQAMQAKTSAAQAHAAVQLAGAEILHIKHAQQEQHAQHAHQAYQTSTQLDPRGPPRTEPYNPALHPAQLIKPWEPRGSEQVAFLPSPLPDLTFQQAQSPLKDVSCVLQLHSPSSQQLLSPSSRWMQGMARPLLAPRGPCLSTPSNAADAILGVLEDQMPQSLQVACLCVSLVLSSTLLELQFGQAEMLIGSPSCAISLQASLQASSAPGTQKGYGDEHDPSPGRSSVMRAIGLARRVVKGVLQVQKSPTNGKHKHLGINKLI